MSTPDATDPGTPDLGGMRRAYGSGSFEPEDLAPTWLEQLRRWLEDAVSAELPEPNAIVLATADGTGAPGARTVLVKGLDERGLLFFTNLRSRKGRELAVNPRASAVFPWHPIQRQVVVDGVVEPATGAEADRYFASRPLGSRLAALASPQSKPIASREALELRRAAVASDDPQRPEWWGGFWIAPLAVEFWQGRPDRLHDRLRFRAADGAWIIERLGP